MTEKTLTRLSVTERLARLRECMEPADGRVREDADCGDLSLLARQVESLPPRLRHILYSVRIERAASQVLAQRWGISTRLVARELQAAHESCVQGLAGPGLRAVAKGAEEAGGGAAVLAEARAWVRVLSMGQPTAECLDAFTQWHAQSRGHAQRWHQATREWEILGRVLHAAPADPEPGTRGLRAPLPRLTRRGFLGAAIAGATALGALVIARPPLGLWPSWQVLRADFRTATGERRRIGLGEGAYVELNTQTSLSLRTDASGVLIALFAGEIAVDNGRAIPLRIRAGGGWVDVGQGGVALRTLEGRRVVVRATEGTARVFHSQREVSLVAGQQVSYGSSGMDAVRRVTSGTSDDAWRRGMVVFQDTPLAEAVAEINRYRPGRVLLMDSALGRQRISGRFRVDALDRAIILIEQLYRARVRRLGDVVILS